MLIFRAWATCAYTDQLYLQKSTWFLFTSVYFDTTVSSRFNWSIQWNSLTFGLFSLASIISRSQWDLSRPYVAHMKRGCSVLVEIALFRPSRQSNIPTPVPRRAKKDSNIPSPVGRTRSVKCPTPDQQRQSNPLPMPCLPPPPPRRLYIDRCIRWQYRAIIY